MAIGYQCYLLCAHFLIFDVVHGFYTMFESI